MLLLSSLGSRAALIRRAVAVCGALALAFLVKAPVGVEAPVGERAALAMPAAGGCGNGSCGGGETCTTCPADCGVCPPVCGDATCAAGESCASCAADCGVCPPVCGNASCQAGETCGSCPADCGACAPSCGDGSCNGAETCASCSGDCGVCAPVCGNASCQAGETCGSCPADCGACPPVCGNGSCQAGESCSTCAADCGVCPPACGNGSCNGGETCSSCPADCGACPPVCGNGTCQAGETCSSCVADCGACPPVCGNASCQAGETCSNCVADCGACPPACGDATCNGTESCSTCAGDCGACVVCGDSTCDASESCSSCAGDCGACATNIYDCPADLPSCTGDEDGNCCYQSFAAGSIIIPMDRCHQEPGNAKLAAPTVANAFCADSSGGGDDGMFHAYGLVYRAMQAGIPVYWMINPTKKPPALTKSQNLNAQTYIDTDIDFWVLSAGATAPISGGALTACGAGCTPPVLHLSDSLVAEAGTYTKKQFPSRGAAWMIDAADVPRFTELVTRTGEFAAFSSNTLYNFNSVEMYKVQAGAEIAYLEYDVAGPTYPKANGGSSAPVAVKIDYDPPRLARLSPAGVSELFLAKAKLNDEADPGCATGAFSPSTAVYCDLTKTDMEAGALISGGFTWAWIDKYNGGCSSTWVDELREYMTAVPGVKDGNSVYFMEGGVQLGEDCVGKEVLGSSGGLDANNGPATEPFILRYAANPFLQIGDVAPDFAQGSPSKWTYGTSAYQPLESLHRLVSVDTGTLCSNHRSTGACDAYSGTTGDMPDVAAYARFADVDANGIAFYMGGNNIQQAGNSAHLRMVMNAFLAVPAGQVDSTPDTSIEVEVSRSAPVVATVGFEEYQYQGTISKIVPPETVTTFTGAAAGATFRFPYYTGHLRAIYTSALGSSGIDFTDLDCDVGSSECAFDVTDHLPPANLAGCGGPPYTNACRNVFTTTETGALPAAVPFTTASSTALQPLLGASLTVAAAQVLMSRVLAGRDEDDDGTFESALGGVDRSTLAVIESSPLSGSIRPTMMYFGGLDGMLHAVCADVLGPCTSLGQELWAFIPRTQIPLLAANTQRVDGSPKVSEVFGDPDGADLDGDGTDLPASFRTIMVFQTGTGTSGFSNEAPSTVAMDVTDPAEPLILWEYATPVVRGVFETGVGLGIAMGPAKVGTSTKHLTVIQTTNGGTGGTGFVVSALETMTGTEVWSYQHAYPAPRSGASSPLPSSGIPGGVAAYSSTKGSTITHVVAPSLYGELYLIDASTGLNVHNTSPLFSFTTDYHPIGATPTIFVNPTGGDVSVAAVSGGYADAVTTNWSPDGTEQFAVAMSLDEDDFPGTAFTETTATAFSLGTSSRAFAQAVVAGNEIFVVTDSTDVNSAGYGLSGSNTGTLTRLATSNMSQISTNVTLPGGSSSVDVSSGGISFAGAGKAAQKDDLSGSFQGGGSAAELAFRDDVTRLLWISE